MGKKTPSPPPPPDPVATANAQAAANKDAIRESARVNSIDQFAPWGSTTYIRGSDGVPTGQQINLSPEAQGIYNQQASLAQLLGERANLMASHVPTDRFSLDGIRAAKGPDDFEDYAGRISQTQFDRAMGLLDPQITRDRRRLEDSLVQKGLPMSGEAYRTASGDFERGVADTRLKAAQDAILSGGAEAQRLYGMDQAARQQEINEYMLSRSQPFNEAAAYIQGAPVMQAPQFQPNMQYNMQAPDIAGLTMQNYNARMNQYNAQMAQRNAGMSGLFGLGSTLIGGLFR